MIGIDDAANSVRIAVNFRGRAAVRSRVRDGSSRNSYVQGKYGTDYGSVVTTDLLITTKRDNEGKVGARSTKTVTTVKAERAWEPVGPMGTGSGPRDNRGVSQLNTPRSRP